MTKEHMKSDEKCNVYIIQESTLLKNPTLSEKFKQEYEVSFIYFRYEVAQKCIRTKNESNIPFFFPFVQTKTISNACNPGIQSHLPQYSSIKKIERNRE